jgi:hypothetical protein
MTSSQPSQPQGELEEQLRQLHRNLERTPGTLAWYNRRERTRPWRVLTATLATTAALLIALAAAGANPFDVITHLIFG